MTRFARYIPIYGAHLLKIFSFIILLPLFTRVFSKDVWGLVLAAQAFSFWLQIIVEYGFNLSATRNIAQITDNREKVRGYILGVNKAKILLSITVVFTSSLLFLSVPSISAFGSLALWATLFAIVQGLSPVWYFAALQRLYIFSIFDFLARIIYILLCILLISSDENAWMVFGLGIISNFIPIVVGAISMTGFLKQGKSLHTNIFKIMQSSFPLFFFSLITSVYTSLNLLILSHYQTLSVVAAYGVADRMVRMSGNILEPLNRVFYAKISNLYATDKDEAYKYLKKICYSLITFGIFIFLGAQLLSPLAIKLFAPNYPESVIYIRLLALYIPILVINNILGLHVLLPLGYEKEFNSVFIIVSALSLLSMLIFVPDTGAMGLAVITVLTEWAVVAGFTYIILRRGGVSRMIGGFHENKTNFTQ